MPSVLLIRHGQASFGAKDYDVLSDLGLRQAKLTGKALTEQAPTVARVVSGTLRRQRDTATALDVGAVITDPRWDEIDAGEIIATHGDEHVSLEGPKSAGIDSRQFQDRFDPALSAWIAAGDSSPCARSWPAFAADAAAALAAAAAGLGRGEIAVAVTSAGVIAAIGGALLGDTASAFLALNRVQINCAITKIAIGARGATLISVNDHSHLQRGGQVLVTYR